MLQRTSVAVHCMSRLKLVLDVSLLLLWCFCACCIACLAMKTSA